MEFHRPSLRKELDLSVEKDLIKFLTWFYPLKYWKKLCQDGPEFFTVHLHREVTAWVSRFLEGHAEPFLKIYEQHMESIMVREEDYPEFQRYIFAQNKVIPKEIWPREGIQPDDPWNFDDIDSVLEEVEKIEKAYAQKTRKKRPEDKSQWNKDLLQLLHRKRHRIRRGLRDGSSISRRMDDHEGKSTRVEPTKLERKEIHERRIRFDLIPPAKQISSTAGNLISKDKIPVLTGSCQSYLILSVWEVTAWVSRFLEGHAEPFLKIYEQHMESIMVQEEDYPEFQRYIFAQNKVIPKEIWPREGIQPDVRQDDEIYHERIKSARNQYYYELSQANKGEDIWSQDPWNFDDIDSKTRKKRLRLTRANGTKMYGEQKEDNPVWIGKNGLTTWVTPSYSSYSTESDTASDEDSVMDLQFRGEWMIMKANQPEWNPQN
nr:ORF I polyprotein [Ipomoea batatas]